MSMILVVDDAAVDRRFAGRLLEKQSGAKVTYASSGAEALSAMENTEFDLVVTDLVMQGMDGLELVAAVRLAHPTVPVIIMTSKGNEEIAARALKEGAASYVPKRLLSEELSSTVEKVLAVSGELRSQQRLLNSLTRSECAFILENDFGLIPPLVSYLQDEAAHMGLCDSTERIRLGVALEEALINAVYHGNLEVPSPQHEQSHGHHRKLVEQRLREAPYRGRRVYVEVRLSRHEGVFSVRDEGPGFDATRLPDPSESAIFERVSGRGLLLIRTFMDEVVFNDLGNEVTLVKRAPAAAYAVESSS